MFTLEEVLLAREFEQTLARVVLSCESVLKIFQNSGFDGSESNEDIAVVNACYSSFEPVKELLRAVVERNNKLYGKDDSI